MIRTLLLASVALAGIGASPARAWLDADAPRYPDLDLKTLNARDIGAKSSVASNTYNCKSDLGTWPNDAIDFWKPNCSGTFQGENIRSALTRGTGRLAGSNPPVPDPTQYIYTNLLVNKVFDRDYSSAMLINTDVSTGEGSNSSTDWYSVDFQISSTVRPGNGTRPGKHWMVNWDGWVAPGSGQHFWVMLEADPNYHNADCGPDATMAPGRSCFNPVFWFNFNNAVTQLAWLYATNNGHASYWGRATLTNGQLTAIDWEQDLPYVVGPFSKMTRDIYLYAPSTYNPKAPVSPSPLAGQQGAYYKVNTYIDGKNITLNNAPANGTYAFQWVPAQVQYGITMASRDNVFSDGRILHASMVEKADLDLATNAEKVVNVTGNHAVGWDSTDAVMPIGAAYGQGQSVCFDKSCTRKLAADTSSNLVVSGMLSVNSGMSLPFNQLESGSGSFVCVKSGNVVYLKSTPCNQ